MCADAGVVPEPREGLAFFFLPPFQERLVGIVWLGTTAAPLQQVVWRKVLTRLQTVGLWMQGQCICNSFRDTLMDLRALTLMA